jgi:endoplasmic reticulum resident protein 44|uniref:Thioredoxin domain-containing protein n=1 Tax=Panagrolaimus sp. PS1159 TaxID=55785 RepID=A0AC35GKW6_9BILA
MVVVISKRSLILFIAALVSILSTVQSSVIQLTSDNIDSILQSNQIVFVNFYADWCRFSQHLKPIFEEASNKFAQNTAGQIAFASVDCDRQPALAQKFHVNKYPTLKLFRFGEPIKREYRGQRSMEALVEFVTKQVESTVHHFNSKEDLDKQIDNSKRNIIGYFAQPSGEEYTNFQKLASALRDDCVFWMGTGEWVRQTAPQGNALYSRAANTMEDFAYTGALNSYEFLKAWVADKCVPLVREITFENAEELTEEGLPFLILFRKPGDTAAEKTFIDAVTSELAEVKTTVNCLLADGKKFAHPLHHLGKNEKDLPLIAIDSFRHMYLFGDFSKLQNKGLLRQFVNDLHSGKLHREFHNGPDPTQVDPNAANDPNKKATPSTPPESVFKQLKPSDNRYSLLEHNEL